MVRESRAHRRTRIRRMSVAPSSVPLLLWLGTVLLSAAATVLTYGSEALLLAYQDQVKNPLEGNAAAIATGAALFRDVCATCHGLDAKGVRGPDLTALWVSGATDSRVFQTIRRGVPGTEMPPSS